MIKRIPYLLLTVFILCGCSLNPPETNFEYRGLRYNLSTLNYVQDGNTFTYYPGSRYGSNETNITISLNSSGNPGSFVLTINHPYEIRIDSVSCGINMPDGTKKRIALSGNRGGHLEVDFISRAFDSADIELPGTEVKKNYSFLL
jgi:hypothetical protein